MFVIIFVSLLLFTVNVNCSRPTLRMTTNGLVEGIEQTSILGQQFYSFRGIPFAAPPITGRDPCTGKYVDRRFKATQPLNIFWIEPFKAYNFSGLCMQAPPSNGLTYKMSEDCLYLNIYVPAGGAKRKTVMVFIHGGKFATGTGDDKLYGPDFLLSQDNIVVTIQYRLGIFGFLNLNYGDYTGNMGLKDQQLALKWIHTNIEYFSGRQDEILLLGQSAGAVSVHLQMLNPESRKYFNRVFAISGSALGSYAVWKISQLEQVRECSNLYEVADVVDYLKTANGTALLSCYAIRANRYRSIWLPTIENPSVVGAFMTKTPEEIYRSNGAPTMDTMASITTQEILGLDLNFQNITVPAEIFQEDWLESSLEIPCKGSPKLAFPSAYEREIALLKKAYFTNLINPEVVKQENIVFVSDLTIGYTAVKGMILQANANNRCAFFGAPKNVFMFRFDVHAALNSAALVTNMTYKGATHGDDICYLFCCHILDPLKINQNVVKSKDLNYDIIMRSVKMVTNFARTGNPSIDCNTYLLPFNLQSSQIPCGVLSNELKSHVIDIRPVIHYDTWTRAENIYNGFNCVSPYRKQVCCLECTTHDPFCKRIIYTSF